ncbi:hypothetical protein MRB53_028569 [Persea americana]|uniref:Uncharacterized protein n=1 Tax=Persea americana TaxID=3435 RepID=A0ACC2KFV2_PERAE|nr:hypothetical protein MRB53_028569 [Persea americana]
MQEGSSEAIKLPPVHDELHGPTPSNAGPIDDQLHNESTTDPPCPTDVEDSQIRSSPTRLSSSPTRSLVKGGRSSTCLKTTKEEMTTLEGRVVAGFLVRDFEALEEQDAMRMEGTGLKGGNVLGNRFNPTFQITVFSVV